MNEDQPIESNDLKSGLAPLDYHLSNNTFRKRDHTNKKTGDQLAMIMSSMMHTSMMHNIW